MVNNAPTNAGNIRTQVQSLGQDDPLKEAWQRLAWRIIYIYIYIYIISSQQFCKAGKGGII